MFAVIVALHIDLGRHTGLSEAINDLCNTANQLSNIPAGRDKTGEDLTGTREELQKVVAANNPSIARIAL